MKKVANTLKKRHEEQLPMRHFMKRQLSIPAFKRNFEQQLASLDLPVKARLYFSILEEAVKKKEEDLNLNDTHLVPKTFLTAFHQLSEQQKQYFICDQVQFVKEAFEHKKPDGGLQYSRGILISCIETECQMKKYKAGVSYWITVGFKFNGSHKSIRVSYKNKAYAVDLRLYLARKSKGDKTALVLQKCSDQNPDQHGSIIFSFPDDLLQEVYRCLTLCILEYRNQKILDLIGAQNQLKDQRQLTKIGFNQKALSFFTLKNMSSYLKKKEEILHRIKKNEYDFTTVHNERNNKIFVSSSLQNSYKLQAGFQKGVSEVKRLFFRRMKQNKFRLLLSEQQLERFSKKYTAVFQKFVINGRNLDTVTFKEEQNSDFDPFIFFMKGVHAKGSDSFVDFLAIRLDEIRSISKMSVFLTLNQTVKLSTDEVIEFLVEFSNIIEMDGGSSNNIQGILGEQEISGIETGNRMISFHEMESIADYFTVNESLEQDQKDDGNSSSAPTAQISSDLQMVPKTTRNTDTSLPKQELYLTHRFRLTPIDQNGKHVYAKKHPTLDTDWAIRKNGGLVAINHEVLDTQKGVALKMVSSVRKAVMNGKSLTSISLPVSIFSQESHLSILARSFSYVPIVAERVIKSSVIQKMKAMIPLELSSNFIGIAISKPFNPVIGQTMQVWIDGCPLYVEQINHHPPVGFFNLYGRGYNFYGAVEAQVSLGLNSLSGYTPTTNTCIFETGQKFQMSRSHLLFSGFLFGDREFFMVDKFFIFERKHRLFTEVRHGPKNKGFFSKNSDPEDHYEYNIYEVTPQFVQRFDQKNPYPTKKDIVREMGSGGGNWSQSLGVDGVEFINPQKDKPCEVLEQEFPLPSNSWFRPDLQKFIQGDLESAQKIKEDLEESQRRDRKLRQKK